MCFFSIITRFLIIIFGILRPARCTQMALDDMELTSWGKYWVVYAFLVTLELLGDTFFAWMPLYAEAKLILVLWLVVSAPQGSVWVFDTILNPLMNKHMPKVEHLLRHGKWHLMTDVLNYTSEFSKQSLTAVMPVVSKILKKSGRVSDMEDSIVDLNQNKEVQVLQPVKETLTNSFSSHYYDTNADEESHDVHFPSSNSPSHSQTRVTQRKKNLSKPSLPELAKKMVTQLHTNQATANRTKPKPFKYEMQFNDTTLKNNPQLDTEFEFDRVAHERSQRHYSARQEQQRYD